MTRQTHYRPPASDTRSSPASSPGPARPWTPKAPSSTAALLLAGLAGRVLEVGAGSGLTSPTPASSHRAARRRA